MNKGSIHWDFVMWIVGGAAAAIITVASAVNFLYTTFETTKSAAEHDEKVWQKLDKMDDKLDRVLEK